MSIILDALKKAQQERKQTTTKTTYTFKNPGQKPRWVVYGILIVVIASVVGYLYIPAFHKPKVVAKVIVKPEPPKTKPVTVEAKKVEATPQKPVVALIEKKPEPVKTPVKTEKAKPKEEVKVAVQKTEVVKKEVVKKEIIAKRVKQKTPAIRKERKEPAPEGQRQDIGVTAGKVDERKLDLIYNEALKEAQMGRVNEAKRLYLSILAERPDHIEALNNLGVIATNEGNTKEALFYFKKILEY
ncbi:MAG: tetratricopeptide repeat protein, partial [Proteobacteria bacterium]|nr:tetratricopeptide repeat protein [Pseudomonadota bacterium]